MELTGTSWTEPYYETENVAALALARYEIAGFENVQAPVFQLNIPLKP